MNKNTYIREADTYLKEEIARIHKLKRMIESEESERKNSEVSVKLEKVEKKKEDIMNRIDDLKAGKESDLEEEKPQLDKALRDLKLSINDVMSDYL